MTDKKAQDVSALPPDSSENTLSARIHDQDAVISELRESLAEAIQRARTAEAPCDDDMPLASLLLDWDLRILKANRTVGKLLLRSPEDLPGRELWPLLSKGKQQQTVFYNNYLSALREQRALEFELFSPALGKWLRVLSSPAPEGVRFWLQDITGEKAQVETHTRLWQQHRALADNSPDIIMRFGANLKCIFANRAVERILGLDPAFLIGKRHKEMGFQQDETAALMDKAIVKVFATGASLSEEFRVETKQGERCLSWRAVPEWSRPDKGIDSVLVIARDITAEKEAEAERLALEERLRESQKLEAIGTLSGGIAHDFNNILAVILGNAELALDETSKASPVAQNLKNLRTAALRGRDLVRQILAFSRRSAQDRKEVMITPLVKETVKLLRSTISATVDIRVEVKAEYDHVLANPGQIQQVLVNLCTNAAQAMADGGAMTISLGNVTFRTGDHMPQPGFRQGEYLVISVSDTGHGMDEETRKHIFEPFFSTRGPQGGTGLGLSVVYGIIKAHEGAVTVESAPGKGSTFTVFLPLVESRADTAREVRTEELKGRGRILFVDDEELVVEMAKEGLSRLGYEVRTETKPEKALKAFEENGNFDVIITDQAMPGMSGMSLAKRLLEIRPDVPIILCTGYSAGIDEKTAKAAGIREFFMKPYTRTELSEIVARVLRPPGSKKE